MAESPHLIMQSQASSSPAQSLISPVSTRVPAVYPTEARDESLDIAKGFGIILVVVGHCLLGLINSQFFLTSTTWPGAAVYTIYTFHMPLFFVVSGHLALGKHRPAGVTIRRLIPSVVYPYFLWSILQGLTQVYMTKYTTSHVPIGVLYKILWVPIVPYWFLYALFFSHVGYLAIRKLSHALQLAIALGAYFLTLLLIQRLGPSVPIIVPETTRAFVFFVLGVVTVNQVKRFGWRTALAATAVFVATAVVVYQSSQHWPNLVGAGVMLGVACAGISATLAWSRLLAWHPGLAVKTLSFLGRYSMSIYVIHIFITAGLRIILKKAGAHDTVGYAVAEIALGTALGVAIPLGINWAVSRFALDRWFGLQSMKAV